MINFLCLLFEIMSNARSISQTSTVKMELSIRRDMLRTVLFRTAAHTVLLLSLVSSEKTYKWSGWCWRILQNFP